MIARTEVASQPVEPNQRDTKPRTENDSHHLHQARRMLWLRQDQAEILRGRLAFHEVDLTTNEGAFECITEELGYSQVPVVVYDKDGTENHWSGLNPGGIDQIISIEAAGRVREA
jgi:glutaredoxin-like protein NrdH